MGRTTKYVLIACGGAALVVVIYFVCFKDWITKNKGALTYGASPGNSAAAKSPGSDYESKGDSTSGADVEWSGEAEWGDVTVKPWSEYEPKLAP